MALNVNRWLNYAKARIDSAVGSGHESLDRLEAKQEADRADKPWLASDSAAPTFDEARARIAWEADQQAKKAARHQQAEDADQADTKESGTKADAKTKETKASTKAKGSGAETGGTAGTGTDPSGDPAVPHRDKADGGAAPTEQSSGHPSEDSGIEANAPATSGDHDADEVAVDSGPAPRSPQQIAQDAERETARLELEDRQQKSAERLAEIRRELGIDDPPTR